MGTNGYYPTFSNNPNEVIKLEDNLCEDMPVYEGYVQGQTTETLPGNLFWSNYKTIIGTTPHTISSY